MIKYEVSFDDAKDAVIKRLIAEKGFDGYGVYVYIKDMLAESESCSLPLDYEFLASRLENKIENDFIRSIVEDYGLFVLDWQTNTFTEQTVLKFRERNTKRAQAANISANARWSRNDEKVEYNEEEKLETYQKAIETFKKILGFQFNVPKTSTPVRIEKVFYVSVALQEFGMTFEEFFRKVRASKFLMENSVKLGFDWQMKKENFIKIVEGNYDNQKVPDINDPEYRKTIDFFEGIPGLEGKFVNR